MPERPLDILLVEPDAELADMIDQNLRAVLWASVTHVKTAGEAVREELTGRHDVVVAEFSLPDAAGLEMLRALRDTNPGPFILLDEKPEVDDLMEAIRLGVAEVFRKPFDLAELSAAVDRLGRREQIRRREKTRAARLRRVARRVVDERRDLNQRMDLICRDLVHAYRRLAQKVSDSGALTSRPE
jgi:DNA-binding response OmpR family regulator